MIVRLTSRDRTPHTKTEWFGLVLILAVAVAVGWGWGWLGVGLGLGLGVGLGLGLTISSALDGNPPNRLFGRF